MDIDTLGGSMDTAINGKVVSRGVKFGEGVAEGMTRDLQGKFKLGKWNYTFTGVEEQFVWSVTNLQIFKGSDSLDLAKLTEDLCTSQGDFLAWKEMKWKVMGGMEKVDEAEDNVCKQATTYRLLIAGTKDQQEAIAACDKLGHGSMVEAAKREEIKEVVTWVEERQGQAKCATLWTPLTDQSEEGVFESLVSGKAQCDLAWGPGQPNGDTTENSVRIMSENQLLEDVDSTKSDCFVCNLQRSFAAQLRGGCKSAKLERLFYLRNTEEGGLVYQGWWGSTITYNKDSSQWEARHHTSPLSILATVNASAGSLLLGPHLWNFQDDAEQCSTTYSTTMSLTGCNTTEFSCQEGSCVPMEQRFKDVHGDEDDEDEDENDDGDDGNYETQV